jgi:voltage-gated potassium channel
MQRDESDKSTLETRAGGKPSYPAVDEPGEMEIFRSDTQPSESRAALMLFLAVMFLAIIAFILPHGGVSESFSELSLALYWLPWTLAVLWLFIVLESLLGLAMTRDRLQPALRRFALISLIPPLRMTISAEFANTRIWLPRAGWQTVGRSLLERLELRLALPMLLITLLILPVIGAELFFKQQLEQSPLLALLVHLTTAMIWFAFALEFILLVSATEKKLDYCKTHWINIIIILLPLVAFLRTLQIFRFLRLTKAGKLLRAYRLRGVTARAMRLAIMLNLIERIMQRNPEKYLAHLEEKIREKQDELNELHEKLEQTKQKLNGRDD